MQTFLPYASFQRSAEVLDYRRLGKQRIEALQISRALANPDYGWQAHPAVCMWRGYRDALHLYMNVMIEEWKRRGYQNTMPLINVSFYCAMPDWLGTEDFHHSHRSNLLRKDFTYYQQFNWNVPTNLPYVWPRGKS